MSEAVRETVWYPRWRSTVCTHIENAGRMNAESIEIIGIQGTTGENFATVHEWPTLQTDVQEALAQKRIQANWDDITFTLIALKKLPKYLKNATGNDFVIIASCPSQHFATVTEMCAKFQVWSMADGIVTWVEDITQVDFRVCAEELDSYDNVHYQDANVDWVAFHDTSPGAYHLMLGGTSDDAVRLYGIGKPNGVCSVDTRTTGDHTNQYGNQIGVTCCNALTGTGGSRPECKKNVNFDDAEQHCAAHGQVLCSKDQIAAGAGVATGCSFDAYHVWTRDGC